MSDGWERHRRTTHQRKRQFCVYVTSLNCRSLPQIIRPSRARVRVSARSAFLRSTGQFEDASVPLAALTKSILLRQAGHLAPRPPRSTTRKRHPDRHRLTRQHVRVHTQTHTHTLPLTQAHTRSVNETRAPARFPFDGREQESTERERRVTPGAGGMPSAAGCVCAQCGACGRDGDCCFGTAPLLEKRFRWLRTWVTNMKLRKHTIRQS